MDTLSTKLWNRINWDSIGQDINYDELHIVYKDNSFPSSYFSSNVQQSAPDTMTVLIPLGWVLSKSKRSTLVCVCISPSIKNDLKDIVSAHAADDSLHAKINTQTILI